MKERPILFSAPMVRATLEGRKTQTRRVVKAKHMPFIDNLLGGFLDGKWNQRPFPYGKPGDRLWVREQCRAEELPDGRDGVRYLSDNHFRPIESTPAAALAWLKLFTYRKQKGAIVPSIHMPRWVSRITLEVVSVRVERLQDISERDAIAEGIERVNCGKPAFKDYLNNSAYIDPRQSFGSLWSSINGIDSWNANPWVWVVEFKRV